MLRFFLIVSAVLIASETHAWGLAQKARLAIVITSAGVEHNWKIAQRSGHGWAAVANLAGIPYDTLFLEQLLNTDDDSALKNYQAIILTQCRYVTDEQYNGLLAFSAAYLAGGGSLILDGPVATHDQAGNDRSNDELLRQLQMENLGWRDSAQHRIRVADVRHPIVKTFHEGQFITQHLDSGLHILQFKDAAYRLLEFQGPQESYPFLSARAMNAGRILLFSDVFASAGVSSFFRNHQPNLFFQNRMYDCLVAALYWALYGERQSPFPVMQLSAAKLSAIGRLDGDMTWDMDAQRLTFNYLTNMAKNTGVVSVYGLVSSEQDHEGWDELSELAERFEKFGGQIGTHSHYHEMDAELTEQIAQKELDASVQWIEKQMNDRNRPIGRVEFFINPNNTIPMHYYELIAKRFSFFMTHGWEQHTPLGYGNLTWLTGDNRDFVVIDNSPAPDYQWFYAPEWSYTTEQITAFEEAIFDHMYHNVGRGVIFNQMWHDYSIVSTPLEEVYGDEDEGFNPLNWFRKKKQRISNENHLPMYDALAAKFASHPIYCPDPIDLANKLRAMARWDYSWQADGNRISMEIDLSSMPTDTVAQYSGGMGIRIENSADRIQAVTINGQPHPAFDDKVLILPNLIPGRNRIIIELGSSFVKATRLTFISKRMPEIRIRDNQIKTKILTKSKARFSFYVEKPFVLLNADRLEWNRRGDRMLHGHVTGNRELVLTELSKDDVMVTRSTVRIHDYQKQKGMALFKLSAPNADERTIWFRSDRPPKKIMLEDSALKFESSGNHYRVNLPRFSKFALMKITY